MLQLIYASEARLSIDIDAMLETSRANNARDEITGLLYTDGRTFLQVLEGPKETVEDCFLRIMTDGRHHRLKLLSRRMICKREFGEWLMLRREAGNRHDDYLARIADRCAGAGVSVADLFADHMDRQDVAPRDTRVASSRG